MDKVSASLAKQNFGDVLERASIAPVAIEKHGKVVAALVPVGWLERANLLDERRQAREQQKQVDQNRLMVHQQIAIELLSDNSRKRQLLEAARKEVRRWSEQSLCSQDYIERWSDWLSLPPAALAKKMCSDASGWGNAMRQNSPFGVVFP
jgi:antitoxin (DNA-binding transcriptional repressor) of toxin-antitoxin stability system